MRITQLEEAIRVLALLALSYCAVRRQSSSLNSHREAAENFPVGQTRGRVGPVRMTSPYYDVGPSTGDLQLLSSALSHVSPKGRGLYSLYHGHRHE